MVRSFDTTTAHHLSQGLGPPSVYLKFAVIFEFSVRTLDWNSPSSHTCHGHFSFVDFLVLFIIYSMSILSLHLISVCF